MTGAVGLITAAEKPMPSSKKERQTWLFMARQLLRDPIFHYAAKVLGVDALAKPVPQGPNAD